MKSQSSCCLSRTFLVRFIGVLTVSLAVCTSVAFGQETPPVDPLPEPSPQQPEPEAPKPPEKVANELIAEGQRMFVDEADCIGAIELFAHAERVFPSFRALNGISFCQSRLGQYLKAYRTIDKLISTYGSTLTTEQRATAEQRRSDVEKELGRIEIKSADISEASFSLDGATLERPEIAGPHLVMPGVHTVVATRDGYQPFAEQVMVAKGTAAIVEVTLVPEREKLVVQIKDTPLTRPMPRWIPWATVGAGAAIGAIGGLFALSAHSDYNEFDDMVKADAGGMPTPQPTDADLRSGADTKANIATGLFVVGGIAAVGGVVLVIINQPRKGERFSEEEQPVTPSPTVLITPRSVGVQMRF